MLWGFFFFRSNPHPQQVMRKRKLHPEITLLVWLSVYLRRWVGLKIKGNFLMYIFVENQMREIILFQIRLVIQESWYYRRVFYPISLAVTRRSIPSMPHPTPTHTGGGGREGCGGCRSYNLMSVENTKILMLSHSFAEISNFRCAFIYAKIRKRESESKYFGNTVNSCILTWKFAVC